MLVPPADYQNKRKTLPVPNPRTLRILLFPLQFSPPHRKPGRNNLRRRRFPPQICRAPTDAGQSHPSCEAPFELDLAPLEEAKSIQISLSLFIAALARNRIEPKRAAVLLYGLQLAASNAKSIIIEPYTSNVTRADPHQIRTRSRRARSRSDCEDRQSQSLETRPIPPCDSAEIIDKENL